VEEGYPGRPSHTGATKRQGTERRTQRPWQKGFDTGAEGNGKKPEKKRSESGLFSKGVAGGRKSGQKSPREAKPGATKSGGVRETGVCDTNGLVGFPVGGKIAGKVKVMLQMGGSKNLKKKRRWRNSIVQKGITGGNK